MIAVLNGPELALHNGSFLKDPQVRSGQVVIHPVKKTCKIDFELFTQVDLGAGLVDKVVETFTLHFNRNNIPALIEFEGQVVDLMEHLAGGGAFVEEDVTEWGQPKFADLQLYFTDTFGQLDFAEGFAWLAKIWGLHKIYFDGRSLKDLGFNWLEE